MKTKPKASEPPMMLPPARSAKAKTKAAAKAAKTKRIWSRANKAVGLPTAAKVVAEQAGVAPVGGAKRGDEEARGTLVSVTPRTTTTGQRKK